MANQDPFAVRWVLEQREEQQTTSSYEAYALGAGPPRPAIEGAGGIAIRSSDKTAGSRELELNVRPVLPGEVEVTVALATRSPDAKRDQVKRAHLYASPAALRDLARQLLETADAADKLRPRPRAVD